MSIRIASVIGFLVVLAWPDCASAAASLKTLWMFSGKTGEISHPFAELVTDSAGKLYGTVADGGPAGMGAVIRLNPPAPGQSAWTETTLWSFSGPDGDTPYGALAIDASGALYGSTFAGGAAGKGAIFKLAPPAAGKTSWTESVLWSFTGGADGASPYAGPMLGPNGVLFGTTVGGGSTKCRGGCGTVFKLTPPAAGQSKWTGAVAWSFTGGMDGYYPYAKVTADAKGVLYGTVQSNGFGYGSVFALTPPAAGQTGWTENTILLLPWDDSLGAHPYGGVTFDAAGNLYGLTSSGSSAGGPLVFKLTPPPAGSTLWSETTIAALHGNGRSGLIADKAGNLYGTTKSTLVGGPGTIFKLAPPGAGQTQWTSSVVWNFTGGKGGAAPYAGLTSDGAGAFYSATESGGISAGGTIFKFTP